jgi:hypothetical protein
MSRSVFADKLFSFLGTLEKIFLIAFIIGVGLRIMHTNGSDEILMVSMFGFAAVSFLTAYKPSYVDLGNDFKALLVTIVIKVFYISIAITIIGLLFFFLNFKGYQQMLLIGSLSIGVASVISLYLITQVKDSASVLQPALLRGLPLGIAAGFILFYFDLP